MGRKPNPVIAEFFERGAKLGNSSNRYEHTCKICREHFPKGRIDALSAHLLKACPAIPQDDRQRVLEGFSATPNQNGTYNQLAVELRQSQTGDLSFLSQPDPDNPLETVIHMDPQHFGGPFNNPRKRKRGIGRATPAQLKYENEFQLQPAGFHDDAESRYTEADGNVENPNQQMLRDLQQFNDSQLSASDSNVDPTAVSELPDFSQQLALAASAASNMISQDESDYMQASQVDHLQPHIEQSGPENDLPVLDPQLHGQEPMMHQQSIRRQPRDFIFQQVRPGESKGVPYAAYMNGFSIHGDLKKQRTRGRFSDDRRKEVLEVRKQGACIRCRMLKKPCSGGDPCSTCANTLTARLWNRPCMRARIADEFDLLKYNIHLLVALGELDNLKRLAKTEIQTDFTIEATHFPDSGIEPMIFLGCRTRIPGNATLNTFDSEEKPTDSEIEVDFLDLDHNSINDVIALYFERAGQHYCDNEASNVMRETLLMAQETCAQHEDVLLNNAIRLWSVVHALTDPNARWNIKISVDSESSTPTVVQENSLSHRLITHQIRAFTEKRAFQLCKGVMHDFEKRLIQRQRVQKQQFETFLTAVILMNCLEKICWVFSLWANTWEQQTFEQSTGEAHTPPRPSTERGTWPLAASPFEYLNKGDRVADIIAMLMKMRDIPPPMAVASDGNLLADLHRKPITTSRYGTLGYLMTAKAPEDERDQDEGEAAPFDGNTGEEEQEEDEPNEFNDTDQANHPDLLDDLNRLLPLDPLPERDEDGSDPGISAEKSEDQDQQPLEDPSLETDDQQENAQKTQVKEKKVKSLSSETRIERQTSEQPTPQTELPREQPPVNEHAAEPDPPPLFPSSIDPTTDDDDFMAHLRAAAADVAGAMHRPASPSPSQYANDSEGNTTAFPTMEMTATFLSNALEEHADRAAAAADDAAQGTTNDPAADAQHVRPPIEAWFERVRLNVHVLQGARVDPGWSETDARCWELKFVSRMLLPENAR